MMTAVQVNKNARTPTMPGKNCREWLKLPPATAWRLFISTNLLIFSPI
jgi:hypothetical protein